MAKAPGSLFVVNFITGISDGLLLPFAAGVVSYVCSPGNYGLQFAAGAGVSFAGAVVFGLARSLGERQEISHNHPEIAAGEAKQEAAMMQAIGIDSELTQDMQGQMEEERKRWLEEIEEHEMGWAVYDPARARKSGMETAAGFLAGGLLVSLVCRLAIPLSPIAALLTVTALFYLFGWCKGKVVRKNASRSGLQQLIMGLLVALAAFVIASIAAGATA